MSRIVHSGPSLPSLRRIGALGWVSEMFLAYRQTIRNVPEGTDPTAFLP